MLALADNEKYDFINIYRRKSVVVLAGLRIIDILRLKRMPGVKAGGGDGGFKGQRDSKCQACGNKNGEAHFVQELQMSLAFLIAQRASPLLLVL